MSREIVMISEGSDTLYIDLESITSIKSHYENVWEYCPKSKLPWWNILRWIGIAGYDCPKDCDVFVDFMGRPYIHRGKRQRMILFFSSGKNIEIDWDTYIYSKWMKFAK